MFIYSYLHKTRDLEANYFKYHEYCTLCSKYPVINVE